MIAAIDESEEEDFKDVIEDGKCDFTSDIT